MTPELKAIKEAKQRVRDGYLYYLSRMGKVQPVQTLDVERYTPWGLAVESGRWKWERES